MATILLFRCNHTAPGSHTTSIALWFLDLRSGLFPWQHFWGLLKPLVWSLCRSSMAWRKDKQAFNLKTYLEQFPLAHWALIFPSIRWVWVKIEEKWTSNVQRAPGTLYKLRCQSLCHVLLFETPMDCSLPGASVHFHAGILIQTLILEWVAIPFSRGSNSGLLHCRQIFLLPGLPGKPGM